MRFWRTEIVQRLTRPAMAVLLVGFLAACKAELYTSLSERDVNEMAAVLVNKGIAVDREKNKDGKFSLWIDRDEFPRAVAALSERGLPRQNYKGLGDVFDSEKLVSTPFEERARFMHALNQELAHSLTQIAGVLSARVHIMTPEKSPLDREKASARASIFIYHHPNTDVRRHVPVIKNLVVNGVNELNYEDVTVALFPANTPLADRRSSGPVHSSLEDIVPFLLAAILLAVIWTALRRGKARSVKPKPSNSLEFKPNHLRPNQFTDAGF